jgi:hypothetical protein
MVKEIITIKDYDRIAKENEYFLWHFVQKNQENTDSVFYSIFVDYNFKEGRENDISHKENQLLTILDKINIPYFESYTEESIDFLINLGVPGDRLWMPPNDIKKYTPKEFYFPPIILTFHKSLFKKSTFDTCYCPEGLMDIISELNIQFLLDAKLD